MRKAPRLTIAAATVVTMAGGALALQATANDTQNTTSVDTPRTLTLSAPWDGRGKTRYIDLGKKGEGPGDLFLTSGVPVRDEGTGRRVGEIDGFEVILSMAHNGTVFQTGSVQLRDGSITAAGILRHSDAVQAVPVTGGTGAYANVRGLVTGREDPRRKVSIFDIELLP